MFGQVISGKISLGMIKSGYVILGEDRSG